MEPWLGEVSNGTRMVEKSPVVVAADPLAIWEKVRVEVPFPAPLVSMSLARNVPVTEKCPVMGVAWASGANTAARTKADNVNILFIKITPWGRPICIHCRIERDGSLGLSR